MKLPLSIRHRLAATASVLVVVVGAVNAAAAYREFRQSEVGSAHQRVDRVARELSDMLAASARQVREQLKGVARDTIVDQFLRSPSPEREAHLTTLFAGLARGGSSLHVELWAADGRRVWPAGDTTEAIPPSEALRLARPATSADGATIGQIERRAGRVGYVIIA